MLGIHSYINPLSEQQVQAFERYQQTGLIDSDLVAAAKYAEQYGRTSSAANPTPGISIEDATPINLAYGEITTAVKEFEQTVWLENGLSKYSENNSGTWTGQNNEITVYLSSRNEMALLTIFDNQNKQFITLKHDPHAQDKNDAMLVPYNFDLTHETGLALLENAIERFPALYQIKD